MAGGYGFWCDAPCARKKDAEKAAAQDEINQALSSLNASGPNIVLLTLGGFAIAATLLIVIYKLKKK